MEVNAERPSDSAETASPHCRCCPTHLVHDLVGHLGKALDEYLPPTAQEHLAAAQEELMLALKATLEHHVRGSRGARPARRAPRKVDVE